MALKQKTMKNTKIEFKNNKQKEVFDLLLQQEKNEFYNDLDKLLGAVNLEMQKANFYQGKIEANQRFETLKFFKVSLWIDLTPSKIPFILINEFVELETDEYLDSINDAKLFEKKGFIKLDNLL